MKKSAIFAAVAFGALAAPAHAATTFVNFSMQNGSTSVANGSFSYDSSLTGALNYSNLDSFSFTLPGSSYDLAFINSGNFSIYRYFGYDATLGSFVSSNIGGFEQILSGLKSDFSSGFFVRFDNSYRLVRNYKPESGEIFYTTLNVTSRTSDSAVPEPATWAMMLAGFGAIGFAMRRKRRQAVNYNFA